jgi:phosphoserine phosphatase RsbU/P
MKSVSFYIKKNLKLQIIFSLTAILFVYRIFEGNSGSFIPGMVKEILVVLTGVFLTLYLLELIHSKKVNPISLVVNIGILNAVLFFIFIFADTIFNGLFEDITIPLNRSGLIFNVISFAYSFIVLFSVSYIFIAFRELFYYGQKKDVSTYFNTMVVFFILSAITAKLKNIPDLKFISTAFVIISIFLIIINSIRISWIAFIVKREKIALLILSVIITILFVVNLIKVNGGNTESITLSNFSVSLVEFLNIILIYGLVYFSILFFTTLFHIPTAEAFDRKAQEVSSFQYFSSLITQVLDFKELADTISQISISVCNAHSSWILWKENDQDKIIINKNIGFIDSKNITEKLFSDHPDGFSSAEIINLNKYRQKLNLAEKFNSLVVAPLTAHNQVIGYLLVAKKDDNIFDEEDSQAINTFTKYASVSIENSLLLEESIEKERMEKELDLAREIQKRLVPLKNPENEKLKISSVFIPAFEVGGDYYDFFEVSKDKLGFVIADVSGKGISAAFIMAEIKGIFESLSSMIESPKEILTRTNEILKEILDRKNFVSAAYGIIDFRNENMNIARAGHCPMLHIRNNKINDIRPMGFGLGLNFSDYFSEKLEEIQINLREDDVFVLFTDGITEAKNEMMEDFGEERLQKIILQHSQLSADEISNKVMHELTTFSKNASQHDDITLVILKWKEKLKIDGEKEWQNSTPQ